MAPGRGGDHAPVSIELGRNCRQNRANDGGKGRKADGARAMANHESRPFAGGLGLGLNANAMFERDCRGEGTHCTKTTRMRVPLERLFSSSRTSQRSRFRARGGLISFFCVFLGVIETRRRATEVRAAKKS